MSEADGDWSVVTPKKDKKASPKAQKGKGRKRTDLQRSSSSNQVSTRRKLANEAGTPRITRSMKDKVNNNNNNNNNNNVVTEPSTILTECNDVNKERIEGNRKLNNSLEEVSSKIQLLSIQEKSEPNEDLFSSKLKSDLSTIENVITPDVFSEDCRSFDVITTNISGHFQARGLINTGCTCFWNCIMQALFSIDVFQRLVIHLLERSHQERAKLDASKMHCWSELLALAEEFYVPNTIPPSTTTTTLKLTEKLKNIHINNNSKRNNIAVYNYMPVLFQIFQYKMDGSLGSLGTSMREYIQINAKNPPTSTSTAIGGKGGKKNNQQDAVEFLTFLLDCLHEEIVQLELELDKKEKEGVRLPPHTTATATNGTTTSNNTDRNTSTTRTNTTATASGANAATTSTNNSTTSSYDDYDLIPIGSRQNSYEMQVSLTRQNSYQDNRHSNRQSNNIFKTLPVNETNTSHKGDDEEGWSTVTSKAIAKNTKIKEIKAVVVDKESQERVEKERNASIISALFHGTLRCEVVYKAKKEQSVTFQRFHCLTLDVTGTAGGVGGLTGSVKLETCLTNYFSEELIDEGRVRKQSRLDSLPQILVLQLGRFSYDYAKNIPIKILKNVEYPAVLALSPSVLSPDLLKKVTTRPTSSTASVLQYQLQAVVLHHGKKATGGHYSTFILENTFSNHQHTATSTTPTTSMQDRERRSCTSTVWKNVNDAKISTVSQTQVLGAQDQVTPIYPI